MVSPSLHGRNSLLFEFTAAPHETGSARITNTVYGRGHPHVDELQFFAENIHYFGLVIRPSHLDHAQRITGAFVKLKLPPYRRNTTCTLICVPSLHGFYRTLRISLLPSIKNIRKNEPKHFGPLDRKERVAITPLKETLTNPPVLFRSSCRSQYTIYTDCFERLI